MEKNMHKTLLLLSAILLTACTPPPNRKSELCHYEPRGSARFTQRGDPGHALDRAINTFINDTRPANTRDKRTRCGIVLTAQTDDAALIAAVQETLGTGWQYHSDTRAADTITHIWQTRSNFWPTQHYILVSYRHTLRDAQGRPYRPLHSLYQQNSDSTLHGAVVFGTIISAIVLPFAALYYFLHRRRRTQTSDERSPRRLG